MPGLGRNVSSTCRPAMCGEPRGIAALVVDNLIFSLQHIKFLSHLYAGHLQTPPPSHLAAPILARRVSMRGVVVPPYRCPWPGL